MTGNQFLSGLEPTAVHRSLILSVFAPVKYCLHEFVPVSSSDSVIWSVSLIYDFIKLLCDIYLKNQLGDNSKVVLTAQINTREAAV